MNASRRTLPLLAASQALLLTNGVTLVAINALAGFALAPDKRLATLPVVGYVIGSAVSTLPASHFMRRHGRRAGFILGAFSGMLGGAIGALAIWLQSFWLLCAATFCSGIYNAFGQYLRFAAAEVAAPERKSRAISLTLAGGIVGGFLGPALARLTRDLAAPQYLASYASLVGFALLAMAIAASLRFPPQGEAEQHGGGRPLRLIARQPVFVVAVLAAAVGYGIMNLLMNATPLAMDFCGLGFADTAHVLQWHVIGMFAPSFFTGHLIARFGVLNILLAGAALFAACIAIALQGVTLMHFWWALFLLGIGWNFLYIGGTTLLTEAYAPEEKAKTQGLNDFLMFFAMAGSSFGAGALVTSAGWTIVNQIAIPFVAVSAFASAVLWLKRHSN
ncbi:MAG TPA: MFS transporter [Candidatus Desulfobacillus sp.]|nr:MFS transporter [Candidatus Desulfobacillus sp.]